METYSAYILILFLLPLIIIGRQRMNTLWNPVTFFILWWAVCLGLGQWAALQLYGASDYTYFLIGLSIYGFCTGFCLFAKLPSKGVLERFYGKKDPLLKYLGGTKALLLILLALAGCIVILAFGAKNAITELSMSTDARSVREAFYLSKGTTTLNFAYTMILRDFVVKPLVWFLWALCFIRLIYSMSWVNALLLLACSACFPLIDLTSFGRVQTFSLVMLTAIGLAFGGRLNKRSRSHIVGLVKPRLLWFFSGILGIAVGVLLVISLLRATSMNLEMGDVVIRYLSYFAISPTLFDQRDAVLTNDSFVYTLGGLLDILNIGFRFLFMNDVVPQREMLLQDTLPVGNGLFTGGNAFFTWCISFYADMGVVGVFLIPLVFGLFLGWAFMKYYRSGYVSYFLVFILFYQFALWGVFEWKMSWPEGTATAILFILFVLLSPSLVGRRCIFSPGRLIRKHRLVQENGNEPSKS